MRASSQPDPAAAFAAVLDGFGLSGAELPDGDAQGEPSPRSLARGIDPDSPRELVDELRATLSRSARGIESERHYWTQAPAFQLGDVLAPYGFSVSFESPDGRRLRAEGPLEVVLDGEGGTRRMTFAYPDGELGSDNYPALVGAVESRLLDDEPLTFVRLADDGDHWRFLLTESADLADLRDRFGERIEVGGRPLLAERQPREFAADVGSGAGDDAALIGDLDAVVAASGIDDVFESIEREAATGPVVTTADGGTDPGGELAELVDAPGSGRVTADVRDVSGERLDEVVEKLESDPAAIEAEMNAFEWLSVPDGDANGPPAGSEGAGEDASDPGAGLASADPSREDDRIPGDGRSADGRTRRARDRSGDAGSARPNEHEPRNGGRREGGLSSQVAETLFGDADARPSTAGGTSDAGRDGPDTDRDPGPGDDIGTDPTPDGTTPAVEPTVETDDRDPPVTIRRREGTSLDDTGEEAPGGTEADDGSDSRIGRLTDSISRLL